MFWNVTGVSGNLADIHFVSNDVDTSNGTISFPQTDINLTLDLTSQGVVSLSNTSSDMQVGSKWPFWIPTNVKVGDPVETIYGDSSISQVKPYLYWVTIMTAG